MVIGGIGGLGVRSGVEQSGTEQNKNNKNKNKGKMRYHHMLVLGLGLFGLYHSLYPSGHALNQVSTNPLGTLSNPTFTYSKAHVHQQEGPHKLSPCLGCCWDHFEAFLGVCLGSLS